MVEARASELPVGAALPQLREALRAGTGAVLVAPPGAGKTTLVPLALLQESWCGGRIVMTSPRRVAARVAAERMASLLGEKAGQTVGYATRSDSRHSDRTRVLVCTEAVLVNMLLDDPEPPGVSALLFDEAHERHLDGDLALALALEARAVLREDLRILVMSATINGARFAKLLGHAAPVIESAGKAYPLRIDWSGVSASVPIEAQVADAVRRAWRQEQGDILAFLPGVREIDRVAALLASSLSEALVMPLHGQLEPEEQRRAVRSDPDGRRRVVLATAIAETSLTLDGVAVVVDSGLARRPLFDPASGTTRLVTQIASRAASDQRAGRAARQGPGVAIRLWNEAAQGGRPAFDAPEIVSADLTGLLLTLMRWGSADPAGLCWLDPPPAAALAAARSRLNELGALDKGGALTPLGQAMARLPLPPDGAAALLVAAGGGFAETVALWLLLAQERGLGGRSEDLEARRLRLLSERGPRAQTARQTARRWADLSQRLVSTAPAVTSGALALARARLPWVVRRRDRNGETWASVGGRGYVLDPASTLASSEWLVVLDAQGSPRGARITAAIALDASHIMDGMADHIRTDTEIHWAGEELRAREITRLGALTLGERAIPQPDSDLVADLLLAKAVDNLVDMLPNELLARAAAAGIRSLDPEVLRNEAGDWLRPLLLGRRDLAVPQTRLETALLKRLSWEEKRRLDELAPEQWTTPAGTREPLRYDADGTPRVTVRVQALFGLDTHPTIGGKPVLLELTSPAGRPLQATADLPGFWRGSWADVRRDMRGRYPKHRWPERPWEEAPSLKTRNAFSREAS